MVEVSDFQEIWGSGVAPPYVIHTFSSITFGFADRSLQGHSWRRTNYIFPFSRRFLHLTLSSYRHFRAFVRFTCGLRRCFSRGTQLLGKVWFVFLVVALYSLGSVRQSFSTILVAHPYLFLCIFPSPFPFGDLPRRHMWGIFHISYIGFSCLYIVLAWHFLSSAFAFFLFCWK